MFLYTIIIYPLKLIIEFAFRLFLDVFKNSGIAVIGVSFAVSILCLPLYAVAEQWQEIERNTQKKLKDGVKRIKDTFKGDEQFMVLSTFYRQNHYHPLMALRSSFGLLIQIPFFIAAYSFLSNLSQLQGEHFMFIRNMGQSDALFTVAGFTVNVLPIAMTIINCIAGAIYTKGFPVKEKLQIYGMALIFLALLYNSPSGLVLYWTMNNVFSLVKNVFYKFKKPLRDFFLCCVAGIILMDIYVLFFHSGDMGRRMLMAGSMTCLLLVPFVVKLGSWLLDTVFSELLETPKWRFFFFILTGIAIWLLAGIALPSLLIDSSVTEFCNIDGIASPLGFISNTALQCFGFCILWPCCIYFLFSKRVQATLSVLGFITLFAGIVNAFFFSSKYGTLTRMITFTDGLSTAHMIVPVLVNSLVTVIVIIITALLFKCKLFKPCTRFLLVLCLALFTLCIVINKKIQNDYKENQQFLSTLGKEADEIKPVLHLSKTGKNVIFLMLDRAESAYVHSIFNEFPQLYDSFTGFTFYPNTISFGGHTLLGAPPLFGSYEYTPNEINKRKNERLIDKNNESLLLLPRVFTEQADFTATMSDTPWANYSWIPDMSIFKPYPKIDSLLMERNYTSLWISQNPDKIKPNMISSAIKRNMLWFCLFKMSPLLFRDVLYDDGHWWSSDTDSGDIQEFIDFYAVLDYLPKLTDFTAVGNRFISIDNDTTHSNQKLQPPEYVPAIKVTGTGSGTMSEASGYGGNAAAFQKVAKWIDYLKENGVYDNTKIIIASDHGIGSSEGEKESFKDDFYDDFNRDHLHPILFVKDFNETGKLKEDMTFMTLADAPLLALKGIVANPINPFTGNALTDIIKRTDGAIVSSNDSWSPGQHGLNTFKIPEDEWYTVKENIFETKNWKKGR